MSIHVSSSGSRGFTLLELLIALAITSAVVGLVFAGVGIIGRSEERSQQIIDRSERMLVVSQWLGRKFDTLRLLQLPDSVQDHVLFGRLTAGHARAILSAAFPEVLAQTIVDKGLSVRDAEALAKPGGAQPRKTSGPRRVARDPNTQALEADLEEVLGMAVELLDRGGAGEVRIKYANLDQLDEVIRRLGRR